VILLAYKRYVNKKGKRHGPYYYKNVRDESGKVKSIYLGKVTARGKKPLEVTIVFLTVLLIIIFALFFIQNRNLVLSRIAAEESTVPFEVDQILIKVLVREDEYIGKELRVMNVGGEDQTITVEAIGISDIVNVLDKEFTIKPGQTKIVRVNFSSFDKARGIEQTPGVYIGKILAKTDSYQKEVPVIAEIESKNVLFDMNLNPVARDRRVVQGSSTTFEIRVFNLQSIDSFNIDMDFFVKDINGNTIISERESVVVKTQASFFKTLRIPEKLKTGNYVFVAQASLGNSIGTASYLFEIEAPAEERQFTRFLGFCRNDPICWALSIIVLLLMFAIGAYGYFFIGAFIYQKIFGIRIPRKSAEEIKAEAQIAKEKKENPIISSFKNFSNRIKKARELRIKRKLELKRQKIELKEREEKLREKDEGKEERKKFELEERRGLVGKCRRLIDRGYKALDRNDVKKADSIYVNLMEKYMELSSERKVEIFKEINSYYKSLLLKKQQLKQKQKQEEKKKEKIMEEAEIAKKRQQEKKLIEKERNEKLREEGRKFRKKKVFEFFHGIGLVKSEKEKREQEKQRQRRIELREQERKKREEEKIRRKLEEERQREFEREIERQKDKVRQEEKNRIELEKQKQWEEKSREEITKEKLKKAKISGGRKKVFNFFHGVGLVKTEREKREIKRQKDKERKAKELEREKREEEEERQREEKEKRKRQLEEQSKRDEEEKEERKKFEPDDLKLSTGPLIPRLVKAIQEQQKQIEELKQELEQLKST